MVATSVSFADLRRPFAGRMVYTPKSFSLESHVNFEHRRTLPLEEGPMPDLASVCRREDALLVVVDIQERLAAVMDRRDEVVASVTRLIRASALVGVPIVVTRQYPKGLGDTDPKVAEALSAVEAAGHRVFQADKVAFDCFSDSGFAGIVAASGRTQVVLAGMETHICIAQTALHAVRDGIEVQVPADACCSRGADAHRVAMGRMRSAGAVITVTESILYELVGEAGTDEFRELLRIVKD
jgi:nicotinamidase-related amidase